MADSSTNTSPPSQMNLVRRGSEAIDSGLEDVANRAPIASAGDNRHDHQHQNSDAITHSSGKDTDSIAFARATSEGQSLSPHLDEPVDMLSQQYGILPASLTNGDENETSAALGSETSSEQQHDVSLATETVEPQQYEMNPPGGMISSEEEIAVAEDSNDKLIETQLLKESQSQLRYKRRRRAFDDSDLPSENRKSLSNLDFPGGMVEVSLDEIRSHFTCSLCGGIYREPFTISECLHTFCKRYASLKREEEHTVFYENRVKSDIDAHQTLFAIAQLLVFLCVSRKAQTVP